ncbi:MAG: hypothetical protein P1V51_03210 [Deltaproteobacteria bacterium]|nr:hypothetical protein [Deltaproteobacteria bacterium]
MASRSLIVGALALSLGLAGCDGGGDPPPLDGGDLDAGRRDGSLPTNPWSSETIDTGNVGMQISVAVGPGDVGRVAYFATQAYDDGDCTEIPDNPPRRQRWQIRYAEEGASGWTAEDVLAPLYLGVPVGLQLHTAPGGTATIATMIGDPVPLLLFCGANDVGILERGGGGGWTPTTIVTSSGQAATGEPASDFGEVVGYWTSLAWDSGGRMGFAYKDVHAGSLQGDDFKRADLELALGNGGGFQNIPVDWGEGAGNYNAITFDGQDRPVIAYHVPTEGIITSRHGIWATRTSDGGATWERLQLHIGGTAERIAVTNDPRTGEPIFAYYSGGEALPYLARLTDPTQFEDLANGWEKERLGDPRFDEGYSPSIAFDPEGNLGIAYYRCVRVNRGVGSCNPNDDAVVFAWDDAGTWVTEVVDEGGEGHCGMYPSLAFDSTGRAIIGYQCVEQVGGEFEFQTKIATREPLL